MGRGMTGVTDGKRVIIGSRRIMTEAGLITAPLDAVAETLRLLTSQ